MSVYGLICIATNHKLHKENITWKGNRVKRLSLNDFICRFFTQDGQADCTFDYMEIWKKMKADSVNI